MAPSAATSFASSPAPDDDALEPLPTELAELVYVAALTGAPVSAAASGKRHESTDDSSGLARNEPRRFMKFTAGNLAWPWVDPTSAECVRSGQELATPVNCEQPGCGRPRTG